MEESTPVLLLLLLLVWSFGLHCCHHLRHPFLGRGPSHGLLGGGPSHGLLVGGPSHVQVLFLGRGPNYGLLGGGSSHGLLSGGPSHGLLDGGPSHGPLDRGDLRRHVFVAEMVAAIATLAATFVVVVAAIAFGRPVYDLFIFPDI